MLSPEAQQRIAILRAKNERGEATTEDFKEFVRLTRGDRMGALAASDASKRKAAKAAIPNADDLLDELLK